MIKRCIETHQPFGLILPRQNIYDQSPCVEYGTVMKIKKFKPLHNELLHTCDGIVPRYIIECEAVTRFRVISYAISNAGYAQAEVELVHDIEPEDENTEWNPSQLQDLVNSTRELVCGIMKSLPPSARFYFEREHGKMPNCPVELSFWIPKFIPVHPFTAYELLKVVSIKERMEVIKEWLNKCCVSSA